MNWKRKLKLSIEFFVFYWVAGTLILFAVFGVKESYKILMASPTKDLSGFTIILAAGLATFGVMFYKENSLLQLPYPYFISGVYIGNFSLLLLFLLDALFRNEVVWRFPDVFLIFLAPFLELLMAYLFGFAFLALIPAMFSAFILYWLRPKGSKRINHLGIGK
jgi:uncharacterized membrane protein (UPF0182 family)